ncbi:MAG: peptidase domain-containing ABC transporter [Flavobacteriaceae bacterium]
MAKHKELNPWRRLILLFSAEKKDVSQIIYYAIFAGLVSLSLPLGIQLTISLIQSAEISTSWIVLISLVTLGVIFTGSLQVMQLRIIENLQQSIFAKSSFELSYLFPKLKLDKLRNNYAPELANRFFDTLTIQKGFTKVLIDVPASVLQIIFAIILLSFYHSFFIFFGLTLLVLVFLIFKYTAVQGLSTSLEESKQKYKVAHWIQEIARSMVSFKLAGQTNLAMRKNDDLVLGYLEAREKHFKIIRFQYIKMVVFKVIVTAGLLLMGGLLVLNQQMNIGQFVASEIIILLVIASVEKLIISLESIYDMLTSIEKLGQVVDKELEAQGGQEIFLGEDFQIEAAQVGVKMENSERYVLQNINLKINRHSRIIVQGESGSGKSSLLKILSGIFMPSEGTLSINELNVKSLNVSHYRGQIGALLSEEMPFSGTLRENITFGNANISDQQVIIALERVGLANFLKKLPKGLESQLFPEGKQIGQTTAKKIMLARSIVTEPRLLLLEDPFMELNPEESKTLIDFITSKENPWAIVVVSQNDYWKQFCTEKIFLSEGQIKRS